MQGNDVGLSEQFIELEVRRTGGECFRVDRDDALS